MIQKRYFTVLTIILLCFNAWAAKTGIHQWADNSVLNEGKWVKIALGGQKNDGIYQITYSQLRDWGFSNPEQVGVYGFGGHTLTESLSVPHLDDVPEVAVLHDRDHQRILFYAQGLISWTYNQRSNRFVQRQHPYSTQACYFLHQKSDGNPLAISPLEPSQLTPQVTLDTYNEYWLHELESVNLGQTGREWYGESFLTQQVQTFSMPEETHLKGHTMIDGSAMIYADFVAKTNKKSSYSVSVNGSSQISADMAATTNTYGFGISASVSGAVASTKADGNSVRVTYNPSSSTPTMARLNYISIQGKCQLEASDKESFLLFRNTEAISNVARYRLTGIDGNMQVWDVTNGNAALIETQPEDGAHTFVALTPGLREYAVVNTRSNAFPGVTKVADVANQNLHAMQPADVVIITAPSLYQQAVRLADYRLRHDSLTSIVMTPEPIYNEYSSGTPEASAIRLFVKQLYDRGVASPDGKQVKYLILFGDGSFDNRTAGRSNNMLLTYQTESSLIETSSCVCDDFFGFLDDNEGGKTDNSGRYTLSDELLDVGVGRITASSASEAADMVTKIINYDDISQRGGWKNKLCFLSDDDKIESNATDSPNLHMRHNEQLINSMMDAGHLEYVYQKIYLPAYQMVNTASGTDYPDARKELNNALQQGVLLVNYAGHGAANQITNEQLMNTRLASELRMKHLPLWINASCDVGRFDSYDLSLGEALLHNPNGGAAALISATRVVYAQQNLNLNQAIIDNIFDRNPDGTRFRLGDVLRAAKRQLGSDYNKLNFCLLGDPTMTLAYPEQEVVVDEVEGSFEALSRVKVKGHVLATGSAKTDSLFNGLIYATIYDAEDTHAADKGLYQDPVFTFNTRNRKVFTGRDVIRDGEFEFSFIVPQDISGKEGNGMINLYACSEDAAEAQGYYNDFAFHTSGSTSITDTIAPVIFSCFLDDPAFESGGSTGTTPFFYAEMSDESGISASGNSIGHDISLYIHCLSNPMLSNKQIILNDYFTTFTGRPGFGNVKCRLPELEEGTYEAMFRVWDVCNNSASRTFTFTVRKADAPEITLIQAYPSPARQGETVTFRVLHNRPESADMLRVQVFTQTGVKVMDRTVTSSSSEVVYLQDDATSSTQINNALNADETQNLMGASMLTWNANVAPGVYVYKAFLSSGGSETASQSKLLMVLGQ